VAKGTNREIDCGLRVALAGYVGMSKAGFGAKFHGQGLACCVIRVGDDDRGAFADEEPRCGGAEARCATSDKEDVIPDLHRNKAGWFRSRAQHIIQKSIRDQSGHWFAEWNFEASGDEFRVFDVFRHAPHAIE
jgi:hypothetical protein